MSPFFVESRLREGQIAVIVVGSGVSIGAHAPSMGSIHAYLDLALKNLGSDDPDQSLASARSLLRLLSDQRFPSPRSVQVRLYSLLQQSDHLGIRKVWSQFGVDLLAGRVALYGHAEPPSEGEFAANARAMWSLNPTPAHEWAAELAFLGRAVLISLNYDGLTRKAVDVLAETRYENPAKRKMARIISSAREIRQFFTGVEAPLDPPPRARNTATPDWRAVPIVKFRGDVFHAGCANERCPEYGEQVPIYHLPVMASGPSKSDSAGMAEQQLSCPNCGRRRELGISFPGVFDKEKEIDDALAAFHEIYGNSVGAVIYLGFSGCWDEALVEYFTERCKDLKAPTLSLSFEPTPAIEASATHAGIEYCYRTFDSRSSNSRAELEQILPTGSRSPLGRMAAPLNPIIRFPDPAFHLFEQKPESVEVTLPAGKKMTIHSAANADEIGQIANEAIKDDTLLNLIRCSQLGLKSSFLREKTQAHTRYHHSVAATLVAMLWHDVLVPKSRAGSWARSEEARIALELAVLFHDARHLPFSHMMEEVFQELNWANRGTAWPDIPRYKEEIYPSLVKNFGPKLAEVLKNSDVAMGDFEDWWKMRVTSLQESKLGVPWLEAIMDSALDADKIEYIFHDTYITKQNVRLSEWKDWFERFVSGQSLTPEGIIRLEDESCIAALELLQERMHLYRRLYLAPELRALECLARYIVITWLEWKIPQHIRSHEASFDGTTNLRALKAQIAGEQLWKMFNTASNKHTPANEIEGLSVMVDELRTADHLDNAAKTWIDLLWSRLAKFKVEPSEAMPTMEKARREFADMGPIGPIYVHEAHEKKVRSIVRNWRVNYPMVALVDMVKFPRFLSTPRNRRKVIGFAKATAEQFLVPGPKPSEWRRNRRATTPLHQCEFRSFEYPVLQLLIVDPVGSPSRGSAFLHQMLQREFQREGIVTAESPEQVEHLIIPH